MLNWNILVYLYFNGNFYQVRDTYYCDKSIFPDYKLKRKLFLFRIIQGFLKLIALLYIPTIAARHHGD